MNTGRLRKSHSGRIGGNRKEVLMACRKGVVTKETASRLDEEIIGLNGNKELEIERVTRARARAGRG